MRLSLRTRIVVAVVLVTLTATLAMAFMAYKLQETETKQRFFLAAKADFATDVQQARRTVRTAPDGSTDLLAVGDYMSGEFGSTWTAINLAQSAELGKRIVNGKLAIGETNPGVVIGSRFAGIPGSVLEGPWTIPREQEVDSWYVISQQLERTQVLLVEYYNMQPLRDDLSSLRWQLAAIAGVVALLGVTAALIAAGRIHRPVRRVAEAAQRVGDGTFDVRVPVRGRDDLAGLAKSFNAMARRLREKDEQQRRFASDVAHDLRTPVASMVAAADSLKNPDPSVRDRSADLIGTQSRRLARLVEDLLEMSRFDAGALVLEPDRVELPELVADAVGLTAPNAGVTVASAGDTTVQADPRRLHTVVCNLLANAVHHGSEPITVTIDGTHPDVVAIEIADSGPGIPAELQPILFDRFTRADSARRPSSGSGLGLAIARENVLLHHGYISVANNDGAVFTVTLPR
ncbi:sensor histidine kinase [Kibdelosporangium phytohabitans]|uniref:histidine kinase n=1 Tax=Kibdelosporangium phytohabitans TaxID=860235 RepID=A0A0N9HJG5_9PSEU|nr:HAMP domain-containing sensor histidine kinase [Kibdelosporangium phytohabitans]ALG06188.1 hypothetical protein AOZ06_03945 [Kibdelosporangium phytohabitans]MBE1465715.1 two-component system sensor histidine kinase MtrB [Kibdelosporangium phytohabitans]